ncbi:MAG: FkbM family methyltransferase [Vicinamibacterales bacterium]
MRATRLRSALRSVARRMGVTLLSTRNVPFGYDYLLDIARLNRILNVSTRIFFDVGANDGTLTLAALKVFPDATFHCFEPHPTTFWKLESAVKHRPNVTLHRVALSYQRGSAVMHEYSSDKLASLTPNSKHAQVHRLPSTTLLVTRDTLDQFCADHQVSHIDVLKIDTEGHELQVLQGAKRMLAEARIGFIYTEFNSLGSDPGVDGGALGELGAFLEPYRFQFVVSYTEQVHGHLDTLFIVANALFARRPTAGDVGSASAVSDSRR